MDREHWNRRYDSTELVWTAMPNRFLVAEVEGMPPGRALDLACGEGRNAVWLAQRGWRVTAADFSAVALAKGSRLAAERGVSVEWVEADVVAWDPPERAFDLVCVLYLQLPASERRLALASAARALAPGGTILVVGHDRDNLELGVGGPSRPEVLYTADALVGELPGMEVEKAEQVLRPVEQDGAVRDAIDTLVRARRP